ncbi:MAG: tetratricopeptide repeat protein [Limisphaerales bacterium]
MRGIFQVAVMVVLGAWGARAGTNGAAVPAQTNPAIVLAETNLTTAPDEGMLVKTNASETAQSATNQVLLEQFYQEQLELAERQRHEKNPTLAIGVLKNILETNAPPEIKRKALLNLALATQDSHDYVKAQQVYAQFRSRFPDDPSVPEILLREGLLYRQMGVNTLAISKFYAVMSTSLKLKLDNINYYKALVLQAQMEIAETYYLQGQFDQASEFFNRILKSDTPKMDREPIEYKLIRSLAYLTNNDETISHAQRFLEEYPVCTDVAEVRFLLASAYKGVGRNQDAMKQVLMLMQSEAQNASKAPEVWVYWQRKAGNQIANQLYKEGDYVNALQVYQCLADLDKSLSWQAPIWYQIGLVYEQLQQWQKATDVYTQLMERKKDLTGTNSAPSLASLCEMAQWRKDYIGWSAQARTANHEFQRVPLRKPETTTVQ